MYNIEVPDDGIAQKVEAPQMKEFVKISLKDDPKKVCVLPRKYVDQDLERIKNMEIFPDDVWVVTYPKCGTTWTQEMVWMIGHNLDYETALKIPQDDRFPFLELSSIATNFPKDTFEECKNQARPRFIKSHLPIFLLPDQLWTVKPKIVYTARNPKDTAISWFHHHANLHGYQGTKADFIEAFGKDLVPYSPMNDHVIDFWNIRFQPNILFLFFEDMKRNLKQEVTKVMKFMEKDFSQGEIDKLCVHLSFDSVKNNKMINKEDIIKQVMEMTGREYNPEKFTFIRKGKVGGYKQELTREQNEMLDEYIKKAEFEIEYQF
ncbi:unnamed protein product [Chironomus riparius]|uniref:Sulfotransferase domain-containing protein n=1 Tax=Chironomus riparius TaxID=315576 RepID=A0A9N9RQC3_9DIPT|nr:unnamed protein product [Chironomus riparius]